MSHQISLDDAITMTKNYRSNREVILAGDYKNQDILPLSETFDIDAITALISNEHCRNFRIYYGMDDTKKMHAILVAVDCDGNDILPASGGDPCTQIIEKAVRCPFMCPPPSALNSDSLSETY
jgi:hypothetical protein